MIATAVSFFILVHRMIHALHIHPLHLLLWALSDRYYEVGSDDLSIALENAADAALAIMEQGVPEAANRYNGSHP